MALSRSNRFGPHSHFARTCAAFVVAFAFALFAPSVALGATINVSPGDGFAKIEAAQAGDEVVLAPGVYAFRVYLTGKGTPAQPIVIRAADPKNPPVFDAGATPVDNLPGSYTAGDKGRGCWQFSGATSYRVSGVVFANCHNPGGNSAGIRYYNGSKDLSLKDCVFRKNDNGLTGGSQSSEMTVEWSEFDQNGNLAASAPTHNIYIYGGKFALRYSFLHDPIQSQNFHIRAKESTIEYNWIARGKSYEGDLMTDDDFPGGSPYTQSMLFRGNVIVQGNPDNHAQIIALFNDGGATGLTLAITVVHNTVFAANPQAALVHLSNADQTTMTAEIDDNILAGSITPYLIEDDVHGTASGKSNWFKTGANIGVLTQTVFGNDPGLDIVYRPTAQSGALSKSAATSLSPNKEYFYDEKNSRKYRLRATTKDIGAFEFTTVGDGTGPYDPPPTLDGGVSSDSGSTSDSGDGSTTKPVGSPTGNSGGCSCTAESTSGTEGGLGAFGLVLAAFGLVRRRRNLGPT